ncbi:zinc-finger domain-containing protein [Bacillus paranthracis]
MIGKCIVIFHRFCIERCTYGLQLNKEEEFW